MSRRRTAEDGCDTHLAAETTENSSVINRDDVSADTSITWMPGTGSHGTIWKSFAETVLVNGRARTRRPEYVADLLATTTTFADYPWEWRRVVWDCGVARRAVARGDTGRMQPVLHVGAVVGDLFR